MKQNQQQSRVAAVLVAAGSSTRMGLPKQWLELRGCPVIAHTMQAFQACHAIDEIVVVARKEDILPFYEVAKTYGITKLTKIVIGGKSRQQSVQQGIYACRDTTDYFAIHDGARPLIRPETIERTVLAAVECGAAATAVRAKDTVKLTDERGVVTATPDRATVWNVQTPQVFRRSLYLEALRKAAERGQEYTDDCQLIEALSYPVQLVEGDYRNIKITTPEDRLIAEGLLV